MIPPTSHAHGLHADLVRLACQQRDRRRAIGLVAAGLGGLLPLLGCGGGEAGVASVGSSTDASAGSGAAGSGAAGNCSVIPTETAGPYPGDGSNSANGAVANVLTLADIVRSDIRSSIGSLSGVAAGVAMNVTLTLVNTSNSCAALAGRAIYLWHCDREGRYSMYSSGVTNQNYLRGVQVTDALGQVTFQTIVPACYSGRWPHIHLEVFANLDAATRGANAIKTSQLALPQVVCSEVFNAASGYSASGAHLAAVSLAGDNVFGNDAGVSQLATVTGSLSNGYSATLTLGIAA